MKRLSLFFAALVCSVGSMMAASTVATIDLTDSIKWKTSAVYSKADASFTADGITVSLKDCTADKGYKISLSSKPTTFLFGKKNAKLSLTGVPQPVTHVKITGSPNNGSAQVEWSFLVGATEVESYTGCTEDEYMIAIPAEFQNTANTYTIAVKSAHNMQFIKMEFINDPLFVEKPVFAPESDAFVDKVEVTISAKENEQVYYTIDGTDPTTTSRQYTAPIPLTETTTIKAIAYNPTTTASSAVESKTYWKAIAVTCKEAQEIALALSKTSTPTDAAYAVTGYITEIINTASKMQQSFWMADTEDGGQVLQGYWANIPEDVAEFEAGMKIILVGHLMKYGSKSSVAEIKNGDVIILEDPSTAVENIEMDSDKAVKVVKNGQLVIIRGKKAYNMTGQVVE